MSQCKSVTKGGEQCRRRALPKRRYCWQHDSGFIAVSVSTIIALALSIIGFGADLCAYEFLSSLPHCSSDDLSVSATPSVTLTAIPSPSSTSTSPSLTSTPMIESSPTLPTSTPLLDDDQRGFIQVSRYALAYVGIEEQKPAIWVVLSDASHQQRLTREFSLVTGYDWSPNGQSLVFSGDQSIWELDLQTGVEVEITNNGYMPVYLGGVDSIAFINSEGLWVYDRSIGEGTLLDENSLPRSTYDTSIKRLYWPKPSPNGDFIAYLVERHNAAYLSIKRVSDGLAVPQGNISGSIGQYSWANDNERIAIQTTEGLFIVNVLTQESIKIPVPPNLGISQGSTPGWAPNDNRLFFSSLQYVENVGYQEIIFGYDFESQSLIRLSEQKAGNFIRNISVSPDGQFIAFVEGKMNSLDQISVMPWLLNRLESGVIWIMTIDGETQVNVHCETQSCFLPSWQPGQLQQAD